MIYVSSSCSKQKKIGAAIRELAEHGFQNIELSGGTEYYEGYEDDILELKEKYNLNFLVHNYFPPPKEDFVLNLASLDDTIFEKSLKHLRNAIQLSFLLGAEKFGFHAGFYVDIGANEIGKAISAQRLCNTRQAYERFCNGFNSIKNKSKEIQIYIENNVYSKTNFSTYGLQNPFMLTSLTEYRELQHHIDFKLLLDVAHLYVSSRTLGFDFDSHLDQMIMETDYIHLSDNDGYHDQNAPFMTDSKLINKIKKKHIEDKTITLEIYTGINGLKASFDHIEAIVDD
ncbi:MAG: sugar phosphate isomerase/epimerase [Deltaproteobacteria bacterium]|nr:sugar phosphate isomerase/epimerase [Deltaproteobacteria bacterium]